MHRVLISLGIGLLIGVFSGYYLSYKKYFYLGNRSPKREVTKIEYEYLKGNYYHRSHIMNETIYNTEQAIVIGIATFGGMLVLTSMLHLIWVKKGKNEKNR